MEETRRGFLKSAIAAGSLIVPFGSKEPEVVEKEKIIELPVSQNEKILDLGDCLVIPKSHIRSWNVNIDSNNSISGHAPDCKYHLLAYMYPRDDYLLEMSVILEPPVINSSMNLNGYNAQVILPYGTLEY